MLAAVVFSIANLAQGQCKVTITAPDSLAFTLFIDGVQVNNQLVNQLSLHELASGKHEFKLNVSKLNGTFQINLKKLIHYQFQLAYSNNLLQMLPVGESKLQINQFKVLNAEPAIETVYAGLKGCEQALSSVEFEGEVERLKTMPFDSQRKNAIKEICKNKCLSTHQVIMCIQLLELEENRLDAMLEVISKVFDVDNAKQMLDLLYLDGNKLLLENRIIQITQNSEKQP